MKKLLLWIFAVVGIVVCIDIFAGLVFDKYMDNHSLGGDYDMSDHIIKNCDDDLLVLGSSVALNSINTKTLEDSLGIKAYNGGSNAQEFPFYLTMLKCVLQSDKKPQFILLGLTDYNLTGNGAGQRYNFLAPYYGKNIGDIDSVMVGDKSYNKLFFRSNLYRLNKSWFRILLYRFITPGITGQNGFIAKDIPPQFPTRQNDMSNDSISDDRLHELREFIDLCAENNVRLIIFFPPRYIDLYNSSIADSISRHVMVWDDTMMDPFCNDSTLFYDNTHVNINGAKIYTDTIVTRLHVLLNDL